ncbi:hypothetical protein LAZ67_1001531 [Cordylochernes scorpioides]|uniref:Uncharacterized protein n=1 Tax=Cordylochernes scorpioides TaxID=51811 RepID=A0ABY6JWV8_9ARAC|nr:hypothetical protein LAZ67_1001531 [Cordylochernes scorpioides]
MVEKITSSIFTKRIYGVGSTLENILNNTSLLSTILFSTFRVMAKQALPLEQPIQAEDRREDLGCCDLHFQRLAPGFHRRVKAKTSLQDDDVPIDDTTTKPLFTTQEKGRKGTRDNVPRLRWNPWQKHVEPDIKADQPATSWNWRQQRLINQTTHPTPTFCKGNAKVEIKKLHSFSL